jgi:hypothetical protein
LKYLGADGLSYRSGNRGGQARVRDLYVAVIIMGDQRLVQFLMRDCVLRMEFGKFGMHVV